jgi:CRISPR/Cas system-associated protein Cas10 (large subunit of type III CRISPR-Cas system)
MTLITTKCQWCGSTLRPEHIEANERASDNRHLCYVCRSNMGRLSERQIRMRDEAGRRKEG